MIKDLLDKYQKGLDHFFRDVNPVELEEIFNLFKKCKGCLFFSGIGKSALVGKKIAVTMTATGTRAFFIPPVEAMHGDVGLITSQDIFIAISKSGATDELLNLLPYIRNKGATIVAITSNSQSRMTKAADFSMTIPFLYELCPYNLAPTLSTTCQTIVGDVLAIALMQFKNFTLDEYALNHPAGTIGKRITVRVSDLMLKGAMIPLCGPEDLLEDALSELSDKKAGCLLVVDEKNTFLGIFTDGDLRRSLQKLGSDVLQKPMKELMTKSSRVTLPEALAWDALKVMENFQKSPIMILPVLDEENHVKGLLKMHDILQSGI